MNAAQAPKETPPPSLDPVAVGMCLAGVAAVVVAMFLPYVSPPVEFPAGVVDNQLIKADGWLIGLFAVGAAVGLLLMHRRQYTRRGQAFIVVCGAIAATISVYALADDDARALTSARPTDDLGLVEALEVMSTQATGSPGAGIYVALIGSVLIITGGALLRRSAREEA